MVVDMDETQTFLTHPSARDRSVDMPLVFTHLSLVKTIVYPVGSCV